MRPSSFINRSATTPLSDKIFVAFGLLCLCVAQDVSAQISGNVSVVSDYRYRGVSLSQGNPEAQLSLGYDNPAGWYAGGLVSGVQLDAINTEQMIAYGGYSAQLFSGISWDAGVSNTSFRQLSIANYNEEYVGLTSDNYSARLYYSPNYFYLDAPTLYGELNTATPLAEHVQFLAHIGVLHHLSNTNADLADLSSRYDYRVGVNAKLSDWNVQIALVGLQKKSTTYVHYEDLHPHSWLLSAAYSF